MVSPIKLTRATLSKNPYEVWNAFVQIGFSGYDNLDAVQRVAHHALWYDSELNNGGHLQYFETHGTKRCRQVISAIKQIGATLQANVLELRSAKLRKPLKSTK